MIPSLLQFDPSLVKRSRVLVTGASGFVGSHLCRELLVLGVETYGMVRAIDSVLAPGVAPRLAPNLLDSPAVVRAVAGMDAVVHLAARTHVMRDRALDPLAEFRRVNVDATLNLARLAAAAGVRRFVFISSIKVNGDRTLPGRPYTADDVPAPVDPYGTSKNEAEMGLRKIADDTGIQLAIIRPVLVYGPGVKANFLAMMRWVSRGVPLPFGAIHNMRSLVASANLVDLIITCLGHHAAAGQTFLVSDGEDLSTTTLLRRMATALRRPARLIPVPASVLSVGAKLAHREDLAQRLCGSLQVDIGKTTHLLGWHPPQSVDQALSETAEHYLNHRMRSRSSPDQMSAASP